MDKIKHGHPRGGQIAAFFEDGTSLFMPPEKLREFSYDLASWCNYLAMLAGGPAAEMTAAMEDGQRCHFRVIHAERVRTGYDTYDAVAAL